ncbi:MAG: ABC transporter ATP-binding protein [Firmicutes bacterium]|jgi:branched-chain amino acid transport system ATP-binding protein|nr:ABC transporter ATP-binding protein [Bacillota bacterium]MDH7494775.1 ABC transporter ATP-binding protein [Bacillota bacterium]
MLEVKGVECFYGSINVLRGVSFHVDTGEIVALIGANGAGKTTTLRAISGLVRVAKGDVVYEGRSIANQPPHAIVSQGIVHVPEGRQVFQELSVEDNLVLGAYTAKHAADRLEALEQVYERFPRLRERRRQMAGTLSGGEQQMLAIGRALMSRPKLLLLDEPSMGLAPILVREVFSIIEEISRGGATILLVEQNARMALSLADRAYVLRTGTIVLSGSGREVAANPEVREAYLAD